MKHNTVILKDLANKKLDITREFSAPVEKVWKAWTDAETLDKWWAPRPWRTETKSMDFSEGGVWLYSMVGPNDERHYCKVGFKTIVPQKSFTSVANFCDADGNVDGSFPNMYWQNEFESLANGTMVKVNLSFDSEADMKKIMAMGFEGGFTMAHGNLDELLASD